MAMEIDIHQSLSHANVVGFHRFFEGQEPRLHSPGAVQTKVSGRMRHRPGHSVSLLLGSVKNQELGAVVPLLYYTTC